jgi:hypothetical protein
MRGVRCAEAPGAQGGPGVGDQRGLAVSRHYIYPVSNWKFWKRWEFWATHSRLAPIRKAAETVRRHIENILTYYQHPVTNAVSEGLNRKIQKRQEHGLRVPQHGKLQGGNLLSVRRTRSVPMLNQETPKSFPSEENWDNSTCGFCCESPHRTFFHLKPAPSEPLEKLKFLREKAHSFSLRIYGIALAL